MYFYSRNNFINDFFSIVNCYIVYFIFYISFSQEEQIHDFLHLLCIRSLMVGDGRIFGGKDISMRDLECSIKA